MSLFIKFATTFILLLNYFRAFMENSWAMFFIQPQIQQSTNVRAGASMQPLNRDCSSNPPVCEFDEIHYLWISSKKSWKEILIVQKILSEDTYTSTFSVKGISFIIVVYVYKVVQTVKILNIWCNINCLKHCLIITWCI